MSNLSNAIEQFHVFSKTPVSSTLGLGQAVNRGGHTVSLGDVLGEDLPFFSKDQFSSMAEAKNALKDVVRENDIIQIGSQIEKRVGTSWQTITLSDGSTLKNKDGVEVLRYHKGVRLEAVTSDNNSGASSQGNSKGGKKCYFAGRIRKTNGELVSFFVNVSDKILGGLPSLGYKPSLEVESETSTEIIEAEGTDYWVNPFAGVVTFEAARPESSASGHKADELCIKISCFEYIGKMADETKQNTFEFIKETNTSTDKNLKLGGQGVSIIVDGPVSFPNGGTLRGNNEMIYLSGQSYPFIQLQAYHYDGSMSMGGIELIANTITFNGPIRIDYSSDQTITDKQWLYRKGSELYWGPSKLNDQSGTTYSAGNGISILSNTISIRRNGGDNSGLNLDSGGISVNYKSVIDSFSYIFIGPNSMLISGPEKISIVSNNASIKLEEDSIFFNGPTIFDDQLILNSHYKGQAGDNTLSNYGGKLYWNGEEVGANYTAGTGITISGKTISVNTSVIQPKLEYITDGEKLRIGVGSKTSKSITIEGPLYLKDDQKTSYNQLLVKDNNVDGTIINPDYVTTQQLQAGLATKQNKLNYLNEGSGNITIGADHGSILMNGPITITSQVPDSTSGKLYRNNNDLYWNGQKINGQEGKTYTAGKNIEISGLNAISLKDDINIDGFQVKTSIFNGPLQIRDIVSEPSYDADAQLYNVNDKLYWGTFILNGPVFDFIKTEGTDIAIGPDGYTPGSIKIQASRSILVHGPQVKLIASSLNIGPDGTSLSIGPGGVFINNSSIKLNLSALTVGPNAVSMCGTSLIVGPLITEVRNTVLFNGPAQLKEGIYLYDSVPYQTSYLLYNNNGTLYWNGNPVASTYTATAPISVSGQSISLAFNSTYLKVTDNKLTVNTDNIATKSDLTLKQDVLTYLDEDKVNSILILGVNANSTVVNGPFVLKNSDSYDYTQLSVKSNSNPSIIVNDPYVTQNQLNEALLLKQDTLNYISEDTSEHTITLGQNTTINGRLTLETQTSTSDLSLYRNGDDIYWGNSKLNNQGGGGTTYQYIAEDNTAIFIGPSENKPGYLHLLAYRTDLESDIVNLRCSSSLIFNGPGSSFIKMERNGFIETEGALNLSSNSVLIGGPNHSFAIGQDSVVFNGPNSDSIIMSKQGIKIYGSNVLLGTTADTSVFTIGPSGVNILGTHTFIGPDKIYLAASHENKLSISDDGIEITGTDSIIFNGPGRTNDLTFDSNGVKIFDSALFIGPHGASLSGSTIINGPLTLQGTSVSQSDIQNKLYNNEGELYWSGSKVSNQTGTLYTFYSPLSNGPNNVVTLSLTSDSNLEVVNGYLKVKAASFASSAQLAAIDTRVTTLETNLNGVQVSTETENNAPDNALQGSLFDIHSNGDIISVDAETDLSDIMLQDNATIEVHIKSTTPFNITWNEEWKWSGAPMETTETNTCYIIQVRHDAWDNIVCKVTHQYNL